ncbi:hypothetical protein BFP97_11285 [Roseivirga sp. 4D4]|nr:hypothetical protein BFP97_11285 [Roseivirga sp. 4D4]
MIIDYQLLPFSRGDTEGLFPKPYGFVILNAVKDLMLYLRFFAALRKRNRVDQKITSSRTLAMTSLLE